MMNIVKVGNSVLRPNAKIIYAQAVLKIQSPFCSKSDNSGNDENSGNDLDKKKKVEKPIDQKKRSKFVKLQNNRTGKGLQALKEFMSSAAKGSKQDLHVGEKENQDVQQIQHSVNAHSIIKENVTESLRSYGNEEKVPIPEIKVSKPRKSEGLLAKIRAAAVELGGDVETTENELLSAYKSTQVDPQKYAPKKRQGFAKVDTRTPQQKYEFRKIDPAGVVRITGDKKLEIFTENVQDQPKEPQLKIWHKLYAESLINSTMQVPRNYFEQLILWTHQGKLWHFPINNEQGMELEKRTDFTEHVFLDKHLEPWCPKSGPLRHFMELVTVGLSKNHYLTAQQKKDHIMWYRDYFEKKKKLLNELGALGPVGTAEIESK